MNEPAPSALSNANPVATASFTHRPLRVWPAVILVLLMLSARYVPEYFEGASTHYWYIPVFGPMLCSLLMIVGWLTLSRATWKERVFGLLGLIVGAAAVVYLADPTMRGPGTSYFTVPMGTIGFALGAAILRKQAPPLRTGGALLLATAGFAVTLLLRNEGMTGEYAFGIRWRWVPTAEEQMLASRAAAAPAPLATNAHLASIQTAEWPGFRGADRSGRSHAANISSNWASDPPKQMWKISVGPAWSSFAVAGKLLFTQEQRGPMETIVCYDAETGREIWTRQIEGRFDDPLGGPGPRATPTLASGGLFVTCATGAFLRLDPASGAIVWQQDLKKVAGRTAPMWGFSASPLVTGSLAIVYAGGPGDKGLLAFDAATGVLRWSVAAGNDSYSSPQLGKILGEELLLMLTNEGVLLADPATGKTRLDYRWKFMGYRALQPAVAGEDTILLPTGMTDGTRAIRIKKTGADLAAEELWTSRNLKPDFTDFVIYQGHVYGVDGGIFTCVDLKDGARKWKGGRYGKGQVLLLENAGLLLVAAEDGRVALLKADPADHAEIAAFKALEGKTWNHPVVVGEMLYLRNAQEAACFRLPTHPPKLAM